MALSTLASAIVLSQHEELFADFFAAAASGAAYWSTLADLEMESAPSVQSMVESTWDVNYPSLFEPHPTTWVRIRHFPRIFAEVFAESMIVPSVAHMYSTLSDFSKHYQERVLARLPSGFEKRPDCLFE
jgi:hypothetical protein